MCELFDVFFVVKVVCGLAFVGTACVKSTSYNLAKAGYKVYVISDCITSYDLKKVDQMLAYFAKKGCEVITLDECMKMNHAGR